MALLRAPSGTISFRAAVLQWGGAGGPGGPTGPGGPGGLTGHGPTLGQQTPPSSLVAPVVLRVLLVLVVRVALVVLEVPLALVVRVAPLWALE